MSGTGGLRIELGKLETWRRSVLIVVIVDGGVVVVVVVT
jgi:hypothetical protein